MEGCGCVVVELYLRSFFLLDDEGEREDVDFDDGGHLWSLGGLYIAEDCGEKKGGDHVCTS